MAQQGEAEVIIFSTLSILQIIKEAQQQHGLRHQDYQRYRGYCSRRVRRLRKSLHFTNQHRSVAKHAAKFQPKKITLETVTNVKFLELLLFEAERCWAYAMQLKQEIGDELQSRKRFHMVSRMRKAIRHTDQLDALCRQLLQVDSLTKLEAQAYHAWMQGCLEMELKNWNKAKEFFTASKTIYEKMAEGAVAEPTQIDRYRQRCQEMQPQLRYCAYNVGDESAIADLMEMRLKVSDTANDTTTAVMGAELDKLIAETREKSLSAKKRDVVWCGYTIPINDALLSLAVRQFYQTETAFDKQLDTVESADDKLALYEKLLIDCRDALQAIRDDAKGENLKTKWSSGEQPSAFQLIHSYLTYVRLSRSIDRYLLVIHLARNPSDGKKQSKPQDLVRLYDTVIQNLAEMESLSGAEADQNLLAKCQTRAAYYRSFRCLSLADAYVGQGKYREALALYDRCVSRTKQALQILKQQTDLDRELSGYESELERLAVEAEASKHRANAKRLSDQATAAAAANNSNDATGQTLEKPISEDLDTYRRLKSEDLRTVQVIRSPPDFRPMPCKPLFFDLAVNQIELPNLEHKILASASNPDAAAQKAGGKGKPGANDETEEGASGLGQMVRGWFWGKN